MFFIRANQNWGNQDFYPRVGADVSPAEVMQAFLGQFYATKEPARQLILSHGIEDEDLMTEALAEKLGRKVEILVPQRGEKAELIAGAARNAGVRTSTAPGLAFLDCDCVAGADWVATALALSAVSNTVFLNLFTVTVSVRSNSSYGLFSTQKPYHVNNFAFAASPLPYDINACSPTA